MNDDLPTIEGMYPRADWPADFAELKIAQVMELTQTCWRLLEMLRESERRLHRNAPHDPADRRAQLDLLRHARAALAVSQLHPREDIRFHAYVRLHAAQVGPEYSLAELRNGTGFARDARFVQVKPVNQ